MNDVTQYAGATGNDDPFLGPVNVSWLLTNTCNYDCGFCWRVLDRSHLPLATAMEITQKLASAGMRKMSWAGGEPLLFPGLRDLIVFTKHLKVETMLITNGSLLDRVWPEGLPVELDWLTLPVEGIGDAVNTAMGRNSGHYDLVCSLLERFRLSDIKLKINTVASKKNAGSVLDLVGMMNNWRISRWKVFQFYAVRGVAIENSSEYELSDVAFEGLRKALLDRRNIEFPDLDLVIESRRQLDRSYFTLAPDGCVYVSIDGADIYLGDLKSQDPVEIFSRPELDKAAYRDRSSWLMSDRNS